MRKLFFLLTFFAAVLTAQAQVTNGLTGVPATGTGTVTSVKLGGALTAATAIDLATFNFSFNKGTAPATVTNYLTMYNLATPAAGSVNGNIGIGVVAPQAYLHIKAGATAAGTAPLKFTSTSAALLTTVEVGAMEYNGTSLFFTPTTALGRKTIAYADLTNLSGTLTVANGGTGTTTNTGVLIGNGTAATTSVGTTTASLYLRRNATNTGYEFGALPAGIGGTLAGEVTGAQTATVLSNAAVIGKVLTGYTSTTGAVVATDNIVQAIGKLNGNDALKVVSNTAILGATFPKITYDSKGLVTGGAALAASDIPNIAQSQVTSLTNDLNGKQGTIIFSTNGTSGAATFSGNTLNIPNYSAGVANSAWGLLGNAGTNPYAATNPNFIGTSDDNDVVFKRWNILSGKLNISLGLTSFGVNALKSNTTGYHNTAFGTSALIDNTQGMDNTAIGTQTMFKNTTGQLNTAIGFNALFNNATNSNNTAVGVFSLQSLIGTGNNYNVGLGIDAGSNLTAGNNNIFIGSSTQPNISNTASNQLNIGNWIYGDNGKIGIGVTNPGEKLDVMGNTKTSGSYFTSFGTLSLNLMPSVGVPQISDRGTAIGAPSAFNNSSIVSIGIGNQYTIGSGTGNVAIGYTSSASGGGIAISKGGLSAVAVSGIAIGGNAQAGISIGGTQSDAGGGIAIGNGSISSGINSNAIAIGSGASASGNFALAIGDRAKANYSSSTSVGLGSAASGPNQFVAGNYFVPGNYGIYEVYFGSGPQGDLSTPIDGQSYGIYGSGGLGLDKNGGNITIAGGKGTGAGIAGDINFSTAITATSGLTLQSTSQKMIIKGNTGNVGIGTSNPSEKLDVMGSVYANDKIFIGTRGNGTVQNPALTPAQLSGDYKLFVNGSAIFTKAVVKLTSNWADYVFEPNYKLPTLAEVEAYLVKHKHLEGVPSAAEVKEKGIDLGDNQTILLKKVEELTLYMIELSKKVETLAKENEELKKKVNADK
jgi:trimeric autotransporter adhesin